MRSNELVELNEEYNFFDLKTGTYLIRFRNEAAFINYSTNIDSSDFTYEQALANQKPVYLSVMASRQQLQPVLDYPQLFDPAFVHAVRLLFLEYDNISVTKTE